jgi:hypothetical protein
MKSLIFITKFCLFTHAKSNVIPNMKHKGVFCWRWLEQMKPKQESIDLTYQQKQYHVTYGFFVVVHFVFFVAALVIYMLVSDRYTGWHHIQEKVHKLGCLFIPCCDIKRQAAQKDSPYRIWGRWAIRGMLATQEWVMRRGRKLQSRQLSPLPCLTCLIKLQFIFLCLHLYILVSCSHQEPLH